MVKKSPKYEKTRTHASTGAAIWRFDKTRKKN
jgi:hypothetical protein